MMRSDDVDPNHPDPDPDPTPAEHSEQEPDDVAGPEQRGSNSDDTVSELQGSGSGDDPESESPDADFGPVDPGTPPQTAALRLKGLVKEAEALDYAKCRRWVQAIPVVWYLKQTCETRQDFIALTKHAGVTEKQADGMVKYLRDNVVEIWTKITIDARICEAREPYEPFCYPHINDIIRWYKGKPPGKGGKNTEDEDDDGDDDDSGANTPRREIIRERDSLDERVKSLEAQIKKFLSQIAETERRRKEAVDEAERYKNLHRNERVLKEGALERERQALERVTDLEHEREVLLVAAARRSRDQHTELPPDSEPDQPEGPGGGSEPPVEPDPPGPEPEPIVLPPVTSHSHGGQRIYLVPPEPESKPEPEPVINRKPDPEEHEPQPQPEPKPPLYWADLTKADMAFLVSEGPDCRRPAGPDRCYHRY
jgi:hypothetical protein